MTENTSIKWIAGLSNGETLVEGEGIVAPDAEASAWSKLQAHLKNNNLTINSFGLWVGDKHFNLPSRNPNNPKFEGLVPLSYNCFRTWEGDVLGTGTWSEEFICAEAIYQNFKLQLWVNIKDTDKTKINITANT